MTTKGNCKKRGASKVSDSVNLIRSVASAISSAQVSQKPNLKHLLYILGHLSLARSKYGENCDAAEQIDLEDLLDLSDVLFTELNRSFENLFSTSFKHDTESSPTFAIEESMEVASLCLRCCMKLVTSLLGEQEVAPNKGHTLLSILNQCIRAARNRDYYLEITREGPLDHRHTFLCTWLEVFIDEILVNESIRNLFCLVDSELTFFRLFSRHDRFCLVEMLSAHFIYSTSDVNMNGICVERLYWKHGLAFRTPQISFCAAPSLLLNPLIFSAPKMIHAYVVLMVCDVIGIKGLDLQLNDIDAYIDAFENSVDLYTRYICKSESESESASSVKFGFSTSYEHLLSPSTLAGVNAVTLRLKNLWGSYLSNSNKRENGELVASCVAYANESLRVSPNLSSKNFLATSSVLGCLILRASSNDVLLDTVLQRYNTSGFEDLYLLAASLKLMSCSLLQAIQVLRNFHWHQSEAVGDVRACKEYKSMMDVVQRFEKLCAHFPSHIPMRDRTESHQHKHLKSEWMLMHLSGLLSVSIALKLDFLAKDFIFGMVVSLDLFILEGGDLEALLSSICHSENLSSSLPYTGFKELAASGEAEEVTADNPLQAEEVTADNPLQAKESCRRLSRAVALKFHKIRTLYLGKLSDDKDPENGSDTGVGVEEERSCNGESILRCMIRAGNMRSSDLEEFSDFIACEPGKDYSAWLKGRERFRKLQSGKFGLHMWNKKRKAWGKRKGHPHCRSI